MKSIKFQLALKRVFDIFMAASLLILFSPIFLLIAVLIKLDSPGPVLFVQARVGYKQKRFLFFKFRSMSVGNHDHVHEDFITQLMTHDQQKRKEETAIYKMTSDKRITRVGRILRKFSLDELPQLYNVLLGQMSMIGPRPAIDYELKFHDANMLRRFDVKPGITGYWQVKSRYSVDYRQMVELDLYYVDHWSLKLDFWILLQTIPTVLKLNQSF